MKSDTVDSLKEIIEIVEEIPERYREIAFSELIKIYLGGAELKESYKTNDETKTVNQNNFSGWEAEVVHSLPEAHLVAENGSRDQQAVWAVVTLWSRDEEANTDSVRATLRDELGITPQNVSNTSRTLRRLVPKYLTREKEGKVYNYRPTRNVIKLFAE